PKVIEDNKPFRRGRLPDVPFTKIALQFLCGHGTPCPYVSVAITATLNYSLFNEITNKIITT
ncbi:MAG: hypothetical protein U0L70_03825, partial [Ruminococcus sp.]|nr:hypothetical protein [Ruminococcus sp.]